MHAPLPRAAKRRERLGATVLCQNVVGRPIGAPVRLDRRRRSLEAVAARHADPRRPHVVSLHRPGDTLRPSDDTVRLRATWPKTLVGPRDIVLVTYLPAGGRTAGGQSTGKQIGMAVAMIALVAAANVAAPAIAGAMMAGLSGGLFTTASAGTIAAVQAGLVLGGGFVLSLAGRAKANEQAAADRPLYGVSGGGNLPRPGDRIPVLYGEGWAPFDLTQPDYTVYAGEDVILYKRGTISLGKVLVDEIGIGASTLWTAAGGVQAPFNSVPGGGGSIPGNSGTGGADPGGTAVEIINPGETSTLVPGSVYSHPSVSGIDLPRVGENPEWSGPWAVCPVGQQTDTVQLDYQLSEGVLNRVTNGEANWTAYFEYAPCDDDDNPTAGWSNLHVNGGTIKSTRAIRFTREIPVAMGRYVVRARNNQSANDNITNTVMWDGLRAHFNDVIVRQHVTEIAVRIRSGKSLGITAFADLWVKYRRVLPVWTGTAWEEQPTRKCVYAWLDIMRSTYGGNLADSAADLERVKYYAENLTEFDTFDGVIRGPVSVYEAANTVLGPMRGETTRLGALWSIGRDEQSAVRKHSFTRRQILRGSTAAEFKIARDDGAADVIVEYAPGGDPRRRRQTPRITLGAPTLTPRRVRGFGISSHEHAYHFGLWIAVVAYKRRERRKFTCDRQGRIVTRGQRALVDAWFMADARAGGVLSRSGLTLTLDTDMEVGGSTYAMLRDKLGREWGPVAVTAPDAETPNVIALDADDVAAVEAFYGQTLDEVFLADDEAMTTVLVGPLAELQDYCLVQSVQPRGRDTIAIETVNDAPEVWAALGEPIPPAPPIAGGGDEITPTIAVVPWVRAHCVQKGVALAMDWAIGQARGAVSYVMRLSYDDGATYEPVSEGLSTSGSYPLRHEAGIAVKVAAYAVSTTGAPGPVVYGTFLTFKPVVNPDTSDLLVDFTAFAAGLEPVVVANVLPNPAGYTGPKTILLTTDRKLYRYTGTAWTKAVDGGDVLANSIIAGTLAAGAINASNLFANNVLITGHAQGAAFTEFTSANGADTSGGLNVNEERQILSLPFVASVGHIFVQAIARVSIHTSAYQDTIDSVLRLYIDGVLRKESFAKGTVGHLGFVAGQDGYEVSQIDYYLDQSMPIFVQLDVASGNHTVTVNIVNTSPSTRGVATSNASVSILESKR